MNEFVKKIEDSIHILTEKEIEESCFKLHKKECKCGKVLYAITQKDWQQDKIHHPYDDIYFKCECGKYSHFSVKIK